MNKDKSRQLILEWAKDFLNAKPTNIKYPGRTNSIYTRNFNTPQKQSGHGVSRELILKEAKKFINTKPSDINYPGPNKSNYGNKNS